MQDDASFGRWMQRRRQTLDLTQAELAQQVGVATNTIHKIEADARRPSKEVAERLAACLAILPEEQAPMGSSPGVGHRFSFLHAFRGRRRDTRCAHWPTAQTPDLTSG